MTQDTSQTTKRGRGRPPGPDARREGVSYLPDNAQNHELYKPGGKLFELRRRKGSLKYFFLDGKLHKILAVNRGMDILSAWLFDEYRIAKYPYSAIKHKMEQGFYSKEVAAMLNRHRVVLNMHVINGNIPEPQRTKPMDGRKELNPERSRTNLYIWSEDNVMAAHTFFSRQFLGKPRRDDVEGSTKPLPNKRELRAMMRNQEVIYTRTKDGEFVPVWKQVEW